jgi:hypothetical protein
MGAGSRAASVGQELVLYAVSAALSCLVLFVGLRQLDPNRSQAKKAAERKKEISRRLGRPYIQTNTYEVTDLLFMLVQPIDTIPVVIMLFLCVRI